MPFGTTGVIFGPLAIRKIRSGRKATSVCTFSVPRPLNNFAQIGRRDFHVKRNSASLFNIYVGERKQSAVHRENQSAVNKFASDNSDSVRLKISKRLSVKILLLKSPFANRRTKPIVSNNFTVKSRYMNFRSLSMTGAHESKSRAGNSIGYAQLS